MFRSNLVLRATSGALALAALLAAGGAGGQIAGASEWPRTDFTKRSVELTEILSGGPPKDGIPAIDRPAFVGVVDAEDWLSPDEPVIVVTRGEATKIYPIQILMWHEIVNDEIDGIPVAVTFCPLCNSTIVYDRRIAGRVLDFGTTGRLRLSDLVMYDRQTESWWQQLIGEAIVGELTGTRLVTVAAALVAFRDAGAAFPAARVLSRDTGHRRNYGMNPYRGYDRITDRPFLFFDDVDPRLPPMERVINVRAGGEEKLYPFRAFEAAAVINDEIGGTPVVLLSRRGTRSPLDTAAIAEGREIPAVTAFHRALDGATLELVHRDGEIRDAATGSRWDILGRAVAGPLTGRRLEPLESGVHFAFAWLAFKPDTPIYGLE